MNIPNNSKDKLKPGIDNHLMKIILLKLAQKYNIDNCYKCKQKILNYHDITIEHKIPWRQAANKEKCQELFWDLENISFSHRSCNVPDSNIGTSIVGYLGVDYREGRKKPYNAHIRCSKNFKNKSKSKSMGYYQTAKQAAIARDLGIIKYKNHGILNFPKNIHWYNQMLFIYGNNWSFIHETSL